MASLETNRPTTVETQPNDGIQDFLSTLIADYEQSKSAPPSASAQWHLRNPRYTPHTDSNGQLDSITDSNGKQVMSFSKYRDGKPMQIEMGDGSRLFSLNGGITYECVAPDNSLSPLGITNLTIDGHGNITFDNPTGKESRITVAVDGSTIERAN
jgi:hypothetical protein